MPFLTEEVPEYGALLPVMPGVLQVEALAQTMAVYVAQQPGFGERIGLFAGIDM